MTDEPGRLPGDIDSAREIAGAFSETLERLPRRSHLGFRPGDATDLFAGLVEAVRRKADAGRVFLLPEHESEFLSDFEQAVRLIAFYDAIDFPGMLVLRNIRNVFDAGVLIDVFSRGAHEALSSGNEPAPRPDRPEEWGAFRRWVERRAEGSPDVTWADRTTALRGFVTLFADSLRALARTSASGGSPGVAFTVHSGHGYQLDYYRQYRYAPVVFGSKLSSPVSRGLATGHYCFQGRKPGVLIKDSGVHFAGPGNTSTQLTDF